MYIENTQGNPVYEIKNPHSGVWFRTKLPNEVMETLVNKTKTVSVGVRNPGQTTRVLHNRHLRSRG